MSPSRPPITWEGTGESDAEGQVGYSSRVRETQPASGYLGVISAPLNLILGSSLAPSPKQSTHAVRHPFLSFPTHIHKLRGQLEGRGLKAQVSGRTGQDEAEVDVDDVAVGVQEDVPVVSEERG